ncbi:MAG: SIS domain-containing protein [Phycisphaerales bacterium]
MTHPNVQTAAAGTNRTADDAGAAEELAFIAGAMEAEADAVQRLAATVVGPAGDAWRRAVDLIVASTGHVVVSGMGKSGLVGAKISATFSSLGQPSNVLHPAEAVHGDLGRVRRGDVVILLSYSGETAEVVDLGLILKTDGVPTIGMSRSDDSSLARASTVHLALGDVSEACPHQLAPTASTTAQLAAGDALALAASRRRNFTADDFHRSHPGGMLGAGLRRITELLRFRAGVNLAVLPARGTVRAALDAAKPADDAARRAGAILLVDEDGRLAGLFTDGDLRRLVVRDAGALDRPVTEVMTPQPKHLTSASLVRDAERLVREHRVDEIPVVDEDGRPLGMIDVQDLIAMKIVRES